MNAGRAVQFALYLACCPAPALAQAFDANQYAHTAWRVQDGAPGAVRSLAQGSDGVLWIGSERGLFRFDGVRFDRFEPAPDQTLVPPAVHFLLALPDTSLWIGHFGGGVSVLHRGRIVTYSPAEGLPGGTVTAIARDSTGTMWAATTRGLARLDGGRWEEIGAQFGYPGGFTEPVLVDPRGSVWAVSERGIFVLPRGAERFQKREVSVPAGRDGSVGLLAIAPDGSIWGIQHGLGLFPVADTRGDPPPTAKLAYADTAAFAITFAFGHPAIATSMTGRLVRLWLPGTTGLSDLTSDRSRVVAVPFSRAAGMSGDRVMAALYDREGSLWVGTPTGIDRFRATKLTPIAWPGHVNWPVVAPDTNGAVLVAARNGAPSALFTIGERVLPRIDAPKTLTAIYRDMHGGIWIGGESRLWERKGTVFAPVALPAPPPSMSLSLLQVHAIARDREDRLWVAITYDGVYRRRAEGGWERFGTAHGLGNSVANAITTDSGGRTWLGYSTGQVVLAIDDSVHVLATADGLGVGGVLAISVHGDRVWVAGQLGVAVLSASDLVTREAGRGRVRPFIELATAGEPLRGVSGVVETPNGELWLNGADGVTRIAAAEVRRALAEPGYRVPYERLDYRDGIEPPAPQVRPLPSAVAGTDGRLWFTSAGGVSWIDPSRVRRNAVAPLVQLRSLSAGGRVYVAGTAEDGFLTLPPRTTPVSVAYTAYSMAVPERVRFRYRLEGLDTAWQDAGSRREAFYTNLPPGRYRFRVVAANDDGVWNMAGASLDFGVQPAWNQTWWFFALVAAVIGASPAAAAITWQRRRSRLAADRARAQFEATLAERARVARELHDTLLGDMAGVAMQLSAGARRIESLGGTAPIVELLSGLGAQMQRSLAEARRAVTAMRAAAESLSLHERLAEVATRTFAGTGVATHVEHMGVPRPYAPTVEAEIVGLVTEALTNARQHAGCRTVTVTCTYAPRELRLRVRDDGRGFDASQPSPTGHWGLIGMRERAAAIGATLTITSSATTGTDVTLVLPGGPGRWTWWNRAVPSRPVSSSSS
jgi:signal transduction histidine kinase/ligand-binding sensor domain-containing protein